MSGAVGVLRGFTAAGLGRVGFSHKPVQEPAQLGTLGTPGTPGTLCPQSPQHPVELLLGGPHSEPPSVLAQG